MKFYLSAKLRPARDFAVFAVIAQVLVQLTFGRFVYGGNPFCCDRIGG